MMKVAHVSRIQVLHAAPSMSLWRWLDYREVVVKEGLRD
ncbi:hypothetical protein HZS61_008850 [Fusarium oxysporum f. sp. conglutinans]|uniref:Uncharacterized protein n=1 Tax=Fusarium oxysporum f. sp. conglutinans TaxID=100902 RepID=A0A8H6H1T6_FUSOX|nr:hypothetical protein HZS61_008850 [Fusarium oxysporum f. sp. conglutinans]